MIACVDVAYHRSEADAACVLFHPWTAAQSAFEVVKRIRLSEGYRSGEFYRRELPCLLAVLAEVTTPLATVIVDGYVWLGEDHTPGLGAHLYEELGRATAVIGAAKSRFVGATGAVPVLRGRSQRPLYVTAAGMDVYEAAEHIRTMHGPYRLPTLLKRVDQLSRQGR